MSKKEKLLDKFLSKPFKRNLTFRELVTLFQSLGYELINKEGSRVAFWNKVNGDIFDMHQPHPDDMLKLYVVKKVQEKLKDIL
ncbi:MAG: type II toxin-antitoxin system HicA family toxin [Pseudomonadota bacterium]